MTVALIDDDAAVRRSLGMLLEGKGVKVQSFASAESFLDALEGLAPSCVVTDVRMPGLTGIDLQRELKRRGAAMPVILITGHGDIAMAVSAIKEGAFDFIEKPFSDERLLTSITTAIEKGAKLKIEQNERAHLQVPGLRAFAAPAERSWSSSCKGSRTRKWRFASISARVRWRTTAPG